MAEQIKKNNNNPVPLQQIDDLTAIYDDYLHIVRKYEMFLQASTIENLAYFQMQKLYPDSKPSFPWRISLMSSREKQHFEDFINEKIHDNTGHAYISLQHLNSDENNGETLAYVPQPYNINIIDMPLPSSIERYTIVYPENNAVGNTEFYVDGRFKAVYTREGSENKLISQGMNDPKMCAELRILVNLTESLRKNKYELNNRNHGIVLNVYAAEASASVENTILEILGSFAEKVQCICRDRYGLQDGKKALEQAQNEGLIGSAEAFRDYVNIRNLMRHQQSTLDELGTFSASRSNKNSTVRNEYARSYLKLFDKSIVQRMKSYIDVLYQMQQLIGKINSGRMIRGISESNSKFLQRVKAYHRQHPEQDLAVELNYPLVSDKYKVLEKNMRKILPHIKITDSFPTQDDALARMEENYNIRSWFLQVFHGIECRVMTHCITRGHDLKGYEAWKYMKTIGLLSPQEHEKWKSYIKLRNALSHNYFSEKLQSKLHRVEDTYLKDARDLTRKIIENSPDIRWLSKGVYEYTHRDGAVIRLDFRRRHVLYNTQTPVLKVNVLGKIDLTDSMRRSQRQDKKHHDVHPNGIEFGLSGKRITDVKLPNGISINLEKQRISWDADTQLHMNASRFNVLQTVYCKLIMEKDLRLTECLEKNHKRTFGAGDSLLVDHHLVGIDSCYRMRVFKFKNAQGNMMPANFKYTKTGQTSISFADGTTVLISGQDISLMHGGKTLSYENKKEFAQTYDSAQIPPVQTPHKNNSR